MTAIATSLTKQFSVRGSAGLRVWQRGTIAIFAMVFIATHWPNLRFDASAPSDKSLHALAFGGLSYLLWRTRWLKRPWHIAVCMLIYSAFDESTQSLPFIHRHTALDDWIADAIGILVLSAMLSIRPRAQTAAGNIRRALVEAADRDMFDRPVTWIGIATAGALGVLIGVGFAFVFVFFGVGWSLLQMAFYCGVGCGLFVLSIAQQSALSAAVGRLAHQRACFCCSASIAADTTVAGGLCGSCGHEWKTAQWSLPPRKLFQLSAAQRRTLHLRVICTGEAFIALVIWIASGLRLSTNSFLLDIDESHAGGVQDIDHLVSIAGLMIAIVLFQRSSARALAKAQDREGLECLYCGHDVHSVHDPTGIGHCPECGNELIASHS